MSEIKDSSSNSKRTIGSLRVFIENEQREGNGEGKRQKYEGENNKRFPSVKQDRMR